MPAVCSVLRIPITLCKYDRERWEELRFVTSRCGERICLALIRPRLPCRMRICQKRIYKVQTFVERRSKKLDSMAPLSAGLCWRTWILVRQRVYILLFIALPRHWGWTRFSNRRKGYRKPFFAASELQRSLSRFFRRPLRKRLRLPSTFISYSFKDSRYAINSTKICSRAVSVVGSRQPSADGCLQVLVHQLHIPTSVRRSCLRSAWRPGEAVCPVPAVERQSERAKRGRSASNPFGWPSPPTSTFVPYAISLRPRSNCMACCGCCTPLPRVHHSSRRRVTGRRATSIESHDHSTFSERGAIELFTSHIRR